MLILLAVLYSIAVIIRAAISCWYEDLVNAALKRLSVKCRMDMYFGRWVFLWLWIWTPKQTVRKIYRKALKWDGYAALQADKIATELMNEQVGQKLS